MYFFFLLLSIQYSQDKGETSLSEIEALYVQTTFDEIAGFVNMVNHVPENKLCDFRLVANQKLRGTLEHELFLMSDQLLSSFSLEVS